MAHHSVRLIGDVVALEPLGVSDADALFDAAGSPETFRFFSRPPTPWGVGGVRGYVEFLIGHPATYAFAVRDAGTGDVVGSTTYCDLRPDHLGVEIGWTWYAPARRGTRVNPACKLLLLEYAFSGGLFGRPAVRVSLKTDVRNARSLAGIARLGAVREGVLRSHVLMPDGYRRDTVSHSILDREWPGVRAGLLARVGG